MTASTVCWDLVRPPLKGGGMATRVPRVLYGAGTPAGTIEPWSTAEKGSIFITTDQTNAGVYVKVANNAAVADWANVGGVKTLTSKEFNVDNGAATADHDVLYFPKASTILTATLLYTEATDASGAADANIRIGVTATGVEVVAITALAAGKAIGGTQALAISSGAVGAAGFVDIFHTGIASVEAGKYKAILTYLEA